MKLTKSEITKTINEVIGGDPEVSKLLNKIIEKLESINMSVDYVGSAVSGVDPWTAELAQQAVGRTHVPLSAQKIDEGEITARQMSDQFAQGASEAPTEAAGGGPFQKGAVASSAEYGADLRKSATDVSRISPEEKSIILAFQKLLVAFAKKHNLTQGTEGEFLQRVAKMMNKKVGAAPKVAAAPLDDATQVEDSGPTQVDRPRTAKNPAMKHRMKPIAREAGLEPDKITRKDKGYPVREGKTAKPVKK
jgi:hypothetical protein